MAEAKKSSATVYICIPVHNRIEYTVKCIQSIQSQTYTNYKVVICDDGSTDETYDCLTNKFPWVEIVKGDGNLWWTGGTNAAVKKALESAGESDYIYTLNNDTELFPDALERSVKTSQDNKGAIVGSVNLFFDDRNRIEPSGFVLKNRFIFKELYYRVNEWGEEVSNLKDNCINVCALSGKGTLIPIKVFNTIGLYESDLLPHYHADTEFTFRAFKNGYTLLLDYNSRLVSHTELSGVGTRTSKPNVREFLRSFNEIKSTHYFPALRNQRQLLYGNKYIGYLCLSLILIVLGFIKRYAISRLS